MAVFDLHYSTNNDRQQQPELFLSHTTNFKQLTINVNFHYLTDSLASYNTA